MSLAGLLAANSLNGKVRVLANKRHKDPGRGDPVGLIVSVIGISEHLEVPTVNAIPNDCILPVSEGTVHVADEFIQTPIHFPGPLGDMPGQKPNCE